MKNRQELRPVTLLTSGPRQQYFTDAINANPNCFTTKENQSQKAGAPGTAQSALSILSIERRGFLESALRVVRGREFLVIDALAVKRGLASVLREMEAEDATQIFFWVPSNFDHAVENLKKRSQEKEFGSVLHLSIFREVATSAGGRFSLDPGSEIFPDVILASQFVDKLAIESWRVQQTSSAANGAQAEIIAYALRLKGPQGEEITICHRVSPRSASVETINLLGMQGQATVMRDLIGFGGLRCVPLWFDDPKNFYPTGIQEVVKLSIGQPSKLLSFQGLQGALDLLLELQEPSKARTSPKKNAFLDLLSSAG